MSSLINKSGKKLAPKANLQRRPRAASPAAPSIASPLLTSNAVSTGDSEKNTGKDESALRSISEATPQLTPDSRDEASLQALRAVELEELQASVGQEDGDFLGGLRAERPTKRRRVKAPTTQITTTESAFYTQDEPLLDRNDGNERIRIEESAANPVAPNPTQASPAVLVSTESERTTLEPSGESASQIDTLPHDGPTDSLELASLAFVEHASLQPPALKRAPRIPHTPSLAEVLAIRKQEAAAAVSESTVTEEPSFGETSAPKKGRKRAQPKAVPQQDNAVAQAETPEQPGTTESRLGTGRTPAVEDATPPTSSSQPKQRKSRKKAAPLSSENVVEDNLLEALTADAQAANADATVAELEGVGAEQQQQQPDNSAVPKKKRGPYKKRKQPAEDPTTDTQISANGDAAEDETAEQPKKKRKYTKRAAKWFTEPSAGGAQEGEVASADVQEPQTESQPAPAPKKRGRPPLPMPKPKPVPSPVVEDDDADDDPVQSVEADVETEENAEEAGEGNNEGTEGVDPPKSQVKKRKRNATPENAENIVVDTSTMSMFDLCKDRKQGKKSTLEQDFEKIDWGEVARKKKEARVAAKAALEKARDAVFATGEEETGDGIANEVPRKKGPRLRLNAAGEIVVDTESLTINRHAIPDEVTAAVEESDLTKRITSSTWLYDNRRDPLDRHYIKSDKWSAEETDVFYGCLKMFGTDFDMISKMFKGRTRKMIKLKFTREEKTNEPRIRAVLLGQPDPMSLETYADMTGRKPEDYKDPVALEKELKEDEERQRRDLEAAREDAAESSRKKQEAAQLKAEAQARRKAGEKVPRKKRAKKAKDGAEKPDRSKLRALKRKTAAADRTGAGSKNGTRASPDQQGAETVDTRVDATHAGSKSVKARGDKAALGSSPGPDATAAGGNDADNAEESDGISEDYDNENENENDSDEDIDPANVQTDEEDLADEDDPDHPMQSTEM